MTRQEEEISANREHAERGVKWSMTIEVIFEALENKQSIRKSNVGIGNLKLGLENRFQNSCLLENRMILRDTGIAR